MSSPSSPVSLQATVTPVLAGGNAASPALVLTSQSQILQSKFLPNNLANDLNNVVSTLNRLVQASSQSQSVSQILITNLAGQLVAGIGNLFFKGSYFCNYMSEAHIGNQQASTTPNDPTQAVFNCNPSGEVSVGNNGWFDVHDPFDGNAAWIGTQFDTLVVTNAVNNGAGLIRLTVANHPLATGNSCQVKFTNLVGVPNAIGQAWKIIVVDTNTVDVQGSVWAGPWVPQATTPAGLPTYQPTIDRVLQVTGCVSAGGLIKLTTSVSHLYETGDRVNVPLIPGVSAATGQWTITVVDSTHFTLDNSTFSGSFVSNGTCLRYFAGGLFQTIAVGPSFENYNLRAFFDGSLKIRNAQISLTNGANSIILDPSGPTIVLTSASSVITLNAATGQIVMNPVGSLAKIVIDATVPRMQMFDNTGALSVSVGSDGTVTAKTINSTTGFSGTATVRNAAGTGTSSFAFVNGVLSSYTP